MSRDMGAPTFSLKVNDKSVKDGVRALITLVEYESIDGMADMSKIVIADPLDVAGRRLITDSTLFAPGNELTLSFGYYGSTVENVGRTIIRKVRPDFSDSGVPSVEIIGHDASCQMMDNAPVPLTERKVTKKATKKSPERVELKDSKAGRRFKDQKYSDAVKQRAEDYGFLVDVDESPDPGQDFIHKAGMTDYDFVKGLANLTGYFFWVDYDFDKFGWTLHFKNPETYIEPQDKEYDFKWGRGDYSTLFSFEPELAITGSMTKLQVVSKDPRSGNTINVTLTEKNDQSPELIYTGGSEDEEKVDEDYSTSAGVKLYLNDFSFEIRTDRKFYSEAELAAWAQQWYRRNRENFVMSEGRLIGVESLRARQIHKLSGLGVAYTGRYVFNRVRHTFSPDSGYQCDFSARKFVGDMPQLPPVNRTAPGD